MKTCSKCKTAKPLNAFNNLKSTPDGLSYWCKACNSARQKRAAQKRRDAGLVHPSTASARRLRVEVLSHYSGGTPHCDCCGDNHLEFLALDHVNGGGNEHRRKVGSNQEVYRELRRTGYPEGFRVLCHNCNLSIGFYGYCPHEIDEEVELSCNVVGPFTDADYELEEEFQT